MFAAAALDTSARQPPQDHGMTSLVANSRRSRKSDGLDLLRRQGGPRSAVLGRGRGTGPRGRDQARQPFGPCQMGGTLGAGGAAGGFRRRRLAAWSALAGVCLRDGQDDDPLHPGAQTPCRSCDLHGDPDGPADRTEERRLDLGPRARSPPRRQRPPHSDGAAPFFARTDRGAPRQRSASHRRVTAPARCVPHRRSQRRLYVHRCRREPARSRASKRSLEVELA